MTASTSYAIATRPSAASAESSDLGPLDRRETDCLAQLFSALGDPSRLAILRLLGSKGPTCVSDIASAIGLSISAVSHQLRLLRDRELITARRTGREVRYSISDEHVGMILDIGVEHATEDCSKRRGT
jgi:DNA-binding transcriptional ArsR family regulator